MELGNQRVLVTGGAGFIGSRLVRDLLAAGADVHVLDNLFAGRRDLVPDGATFTNVDVRSDVLGDAVRDYDPDAVVHLTAIHYLPYCNDHPEETFDVNVMGARNLLAAARDVDLESVVFASSAAVYPPREGPNAEGSAVGPTDIYDRTKLTGEDLARLYHHDTGTTTAAARIFNTYVPRETNDHLVPASLDQISDGSLEVDLGNLTPGRDFVHVRDVSRALVTLVTDFDGGFDQFNIGTGVEHTVREVVEATSEALGEDITIAQDEDRVRESDRPHLQADPGKMRRELGREADTDLVEGLRDLIEREQVRA